METNKNYDETNRLQELGGSDFEIADNQPNIKGWTVKNTQGQTIGEVEELIFDVESRKVRYMVVDLEDSVLDLEPRDVLVPIGLAELHESEDDVILPHITADQLRALPTYEKGRIGRDTESSVRSVFGGLGAAVGAAGAALTGTAPANQSEDFYNHDHFNEGNLNRNRLGSNNAAESERAIPIIEENLQVGKQEIETGGARISSRIVEQEVEENITLREEHVQIERNPVNRPVSSADLSSFREGTIELTEHAEVPVVNKEARVVEEIILEKEVTEHDEVIRDTVRKTEVDVDNLRADTNNLRNDTDSDTYLTDEDRNR